MLLPPLAPDRARQIAAGFADAHVLVIGDAMLDKFIVGRVSRISPEAPVPVVAFDHEMYRMGGSANVANNIAALGAHATLVAVTGTDDGAATLASACREAGIAPSLVGDAARPTTTKVRIVTERNQQVARIDYEHDAEISGDIEQRVIAELQKHAARASTIIVSDYLKGCITQRVVAAAVAAAGGSRPVLVDPKIPHVDYYSGVSVITPNHHEAEIAANMRVRSEDDARIAARVFRERAKCGSVVMTRGDQGVWLLAEGVEGHLPASAREVADVTGAGDTVIATLALGLAAGATMAEAARFANEAAGLVVGKFGPATVNAAELLQAVGAGPEGPILDTHRVNGQPT
jgi:D-beta-D-heptose 7-phosphate kinase/D-beta-D-heptose 1-phosphate adenosyltransferase